MALFKKHINLVSENNTGFGVNSENSGGRFVTIDGKPNVEKRGMSVFERYSWYHTMLSLPRWKFFLFIFLVYVLINLFFAVVYFTLGVEHLGGINKGTSFHNFIESFFFSAQTFTTVGYGRINPVGYTASSIAAFEAFLGLLAFALATGLLYGRFSKPKAYLKFSGNALIAPFKDSIAIMFRMVPFKNNLLTEVEVKVTLAMRINENGKLINKFFNLPLEISKLSSLSLSWTIVHPIDNNSPLYGFTENDFKINYLELIAIVRGFDEDYSNTVVTRSSYSNSEIIYGAKFNMMYHADIGKKKTILELDKLNDFEKAVLPIVPVISSATEKVLS